MLNYKVGILGSGTMGLQLSAFFSSYNIDVIVWNHKVNNNFHKNINRLIKIHKRLGDISKDTLPKDIVYTDNMNELYDCDIIIETVAEDKSLKLDLFSKLNEILVNPKVIATNTSTFSINELSEGTKFKNLFLGAHFFNPLLSLKLVEVIKSSETSNETIIYMVNFLEQLGKVAIPVSDTVGFVVNRLLFLMINESINMVESEVSNIKNIDTCMKLGANHSMGPIELADLIGLDICLDILSSLYESNKNIKYKPAQLLIDNVNNGYLGKKSGRGFYNY